MKPLFYSKTLIVMAVAVATAAAAVSQAQEQPIPPPATEGALPSDIVPGSPLADVVKMLQAGVDINTIKSYVLNCQTAFNLDADKILFLKDEGAPSDLINAMLDRDKALYAATFIPAPVPTTAPETTVTTTDTTIPQDTTPPPTPPEVTPADFNQSLTPYGTWVDIDGYGRCWRPTVAIYDSGWSPYCDRGHWVYTDFGWYWDSDYAWGVAFHYGRWFHHPHSGWCWYPDTVWAPSWVTWRSDAQNCGWAPLPPFAVFRPGTGFFYRGVRVGADFDFGLGADSFVFVGADHFFERHPRSFRAGPEQASEVFRHTAVVNNFDARNRFLANRGMVVERLAGVTHHPIATVPIRELPNAGRQGWRGEGAGQTMHPFHSPAQNSPPATGYRQNPAATLPGAADARPAGAIHAPVPSSQPAAIYHQNQVAGPLGATPNHFSTPPTPAPQPWASPAPPVRSVAAESLPQHEAVPPQQHEVSEPPVAATHNQPAGSAPSPGEPPAQKAGSGSNKGPGNGNGH